MCFLSAYNESEEELARCIDSISQARYDDKRKLLCIVCDGGATSSNEEQTTAQILKNILGVVGDSIGPLEYVSLGAGTELQNFAKVYSGLYETLGHIVPFVLIEKVGIKAEEGSIAPGRRGKRDSQVLILSFLNRVHCNLPMSPLQLEMYHQIQNIIGVNPNFYEFLLVVDSDTVIDRHALSLYVAAFQTDTRIVGVCGETRLINDKTSIWSMIQVFEYHASYHSSKAFESFFGSVTCLPGWYEPSSLYSTRP